MVAALLLAATLTQQPVRALPASGTVTGTVRIADGGSPAGVRVAAMTANDPTGASLLSITETDSAGRYRLSNIPEGRYYIVAGRLNSPTYYPGSPDKAKATEIKVDRLGVTPNINFTVSPGNKRPPAPPTLTERSTLQNAIAEKNPDTKVRLLLDFERNFSTSSLVAQADVALADLYIAKGDLGKTLEYGERVIQRDPLNASVLVQVSRSYAMLQHLDRALEYAERAVAVVSKLKTQPAPARMEQLVWKNWIATLDTSAKDNLAWVKQTVVWQRYTFASRSQASQTRR